MTQDNWRLHGILHSYSWLQRLWERTHTHTHTHRGEGVCVCVLSVSVCLLSLTCTLVDCGLHSGSGLWQLQVCTSYIWPVKIHGHDSGSTLPWQHWPTMVETGICLCVCVFFSLHEHNWGKTVGCCSAPLQEAAVLQLHLCSAPPIVCTPRTHTHTQGEMIESKISGNICYTFITWHRWLRFRTKMIFFLIYNAGLHLKVNWDR